MYEEYNNGAHSFFWLGGGGQKHIHDKEYEGLSSVVNDGIKIKCEALTALIFIEITQ